MRKVTLYSTDEEVLRRMLTMENAIDWSTYFLVGGMSSPPILFYIIYIIIVTSGYFNYINSRM